MTIKLQEASVASITMNLDDVSHFSKLLVALEESQDELGVTDYALGMSSLEDVFMALGQSSDKAKDDSVVGTTRDIQDLEAQTETTTAERSETRWWFQTFFISPLFGEDFQFV